MPAGFARSDIFSASLAVFAVFIALPSPINAFATVINPPIFENVNASASDEMPVVKMRVAVSCSVINSQMLFKSVATSVATGANILPIVSERSPQALAQPLSLPSVESASAFACAKPERESS